MPQYIYPPRPKSKIKPTQLDFMETQNLYICQPKFDGDRCVACIENNTVYLGNRHGKWHHSSLFPEIRHQLLVQKLPNSTYLDGELVKMGNMHHLVLFDVLKISEYLIGVRQIDRLRKLRDLFGGFRHSQHLPDAVEEISSNVSLAKNGEKGFTKHFRQLVGLPLIEGLVLRERDAVLDNWGSSQYEVNWQIRCRRPHKNYRF